jgi:hypothetical protein
MYQYARYDCICRSCVHVGQQQVAESAHGCRATLTKGGTACNPKAARHRLARARLLAFGLNVLYEWSELLVSVHAWSGRRLTICFDSWHACCLHQLILHHGMSCIRHYVLNAQLLIPMHHECSSRPPSCDPAAGMRPAPVQHIAQVQEGLTGVSSTWPNPLLALQQRVCRARSSAHCRRGATTRAARAQQSGACLLVHIADASHAVKHAG